jgi:hypothetical protein
MIINETFDEQNVKNTVPDTYDYTVNVLDIKTSVSALYLWALFGFLSVMITCDFNRWIHSNIWFRHFVGIIAFFFLFVVVDNSSPLPLHLLWLKTILVYVIFLLMIKSKWYYSLPVFLLLIIDQSLKVHSDFLKSVNKDDPNIDSTEKVRKTMSYIIYILIIMGFITYGVRQYFNYGKNFSWIKLLFHSSCKNITENYK